MYKVEDLFDESSFEYRENVIDYFVNSEYPNEYFLQQFHEPYPKPFCYKKYWEAFAQILVRRGLPKIYDVIPDILLWWQDTNWPGFFTVEKFAIENKDTFLPFIKKRLQDSYYERDIGWFKWLLDLLMKTDISLTKKQIKEIERLLDYLDDDRWKESEIKFKDFFTYLKAL